MVTLGANFINIFLALLLSYLTDRRSLRVEKEIAEKEHLRTELAFLRSQVNPHFLFNTINDIYALTQQQAKEAPAALLKLSGLLRYMLRESEEQFVPLDDEIAYLENVIELQRVWQKHNCYFDFRTEGSFSGYVIAPLILINFVENAFKHGAFNDPDNPILILISLENNELEFKVTNQVKPLKKDKRVGIGLPNVRRRLSLIYPNRHELRISKQADSYSIDLKIKLI
ncbi:sensor histidine kinase [Mucilaginibacter paludis]|uniref:sensor histidine kinase n=1 Tax=Mucilaginibacter paludis TaxID=423351 RepID=UPI0001E9D8D7|nr:histidine kinase [Mucilaginibacter paludis]